jgi:hypothetical protein
MTQQMPNDEVDTALILEGELKRRVKEVAVSVVRDEVKRQMDELFNARKAEMLMEVCLAVGKTLRVIENEGRKPLWEATPEEFGLTREELNRSHMEKDTDYAIR